MFLNASKQYSLKRKPSPWGLVFPVSECTLQASKGEKKPKVVPICKAYEPQQWLALEDISKVTVAILFWGYSTTV